MRLLKKFLTSIGSMYQPDEVTSINSKRFTYALSVDYPGNKMTYNGFYLGQNRRWFTPSSLLLQELSREEQTRKIVLGREAAWLFVVGKDIFEENVKSFGAGVELGTYCLVMFGEDCIGYGRYETSGNLRVVKNMYDIGDFLRRE